MLCRNYRLFLFYCVRKLHGFLSLGMNYEENNPSKSGNALWALSRNVVEYSLLRGISRNTPSFKLAGALLWSVHLVSGAAGDFHVIDKISTRLLFDVHSIQLPVAAESDKNQVIIPFIAGRVHEPSIKKFKLADVSSWKFFGDSNHGKRQFVGGVGFVYGPASQEKLVEYLIEELALRLENDNPIDNMDAIVTTIQERRPQEDLSFEKFGYDIYKIRKIVGKDNLHSDDNKYRSHHANDIFMPVAYRGLLNVVALDPVLDPFARNSSRKTQLDALKNEAQARCKKAIEKNSSAVLADVPVLVLKKDLSDFDEQVFNHR